MENIVGGLAKEASAQDKVNRAGHFATFLSNDPLMPCNIVAEKYRQSCYFYQTSRMIQVFNGDFKKVANECTSIDVQYRDSCFASMGRDVGGSSVNNPEQAIRYCGYAPPGNYRVDCLGGAVQNTMWDPSGQNEAITFCSSLSVPAALQMCYLTIIDRAQDVLAKQDLPAFCAKIPTAYRARCGTSR